MSWWLGATCRPRPWSVPTAHTSTGAVQGLGGSMAFFISFRMGSGGWGFAGSSMRGWGLRERMVS